MNKKTDFSANELLHSSLQKREEQDAFRKLRVTEGLADFCSNDYLGFARSGELNRKVHEEWEQLGLAINGSGGSRLLSGNTAYAENLELFLARFHDTEAALLYNSGYDANVGLFSCIGQKGTTIIYDELIHASVHDGIRLSAATTFLFRHNDLQHLEERLKAATGITYVAVESIYSMDGDQADLKHILALCEQYGANLIVDEAHATGVFGKFGSGLVQQLNIQDRVFARVHTFGKALGCHGAAVLGSALLRNYLINFSRAFIYTTALPLKSLVAIHQAYLALEEQPGQMDQLLGKVRLFRNGLSVSLGEFLIESHSPIQCVLVPGNQAVKAAAAQLQSKGFDIRPILSPTVPKGRERLRICLHLFNREEEINRLCAEIVRYFSECGLVK